MSLPTALDSVRTLQHSLQAKAKTEPAFRFYSLWDKVCRRDVLAYAYQRCRANGGAPGCDGVRFEAIERQGLDGWLEMLQEELRSKRYAPQPLLRVWIPKSNGGQRPLGIPTIRDRVAQMAVLLVVGPIFEADLLPQQYGFRPGLDAKMAVRTAYFSITKRGRREVVDADLSDYFSSIPHGDLMRCLARRIADRSVLAVFRAWLNAPVVERTPKGVRQTTEAKDRKRGTPQGGIVSPMLGNLYFRRFLLAWHGQGHDRRLGANVVNYADDFVILCKPGNGTQAMETMRKLMARLGLTVNEKKTKLVRLPEEQFDFLGYTIGRLYTHEGRAYIGTRPSRKAVRKLLERIHDETMIRMGWVSPTDQIERLNQLLRGWAGYFNQGPVVHIYNGIQHYTERRLRRWLMRRRGMRGTGYRQYPDSYLYETLGLLQLPRSRTDLSSAKA